MPDVAMNGHQTARDGDFIFADLTESWPLTLCPAVPGASVSILVADNPGGSGALSIRCQEGDDFWGLGALNNGNGDQKTADMADLGSLSTFTCFVDGHWNRENA